MKKILPLFIAVCLICGCASAAYKSSLESLPKGDFSVEIPSGWWKPQYIKKYLITKDGPFLQYVLIQQRPIDRPFKKTQKKLRRGMLPLEFSKIVTDEIAADRNILNFNVIENSPATIDGRAGFEEHLEDPPVPHHRGPVQGRVDEVVTSLDGFRELLNSL